MIVRANADHHRGVTGFEGFLQYDVAAGCPPEVEFRQAVERRGAEIASGGGDGLRSVGVTIRPVPGGFSGEVRIEPRQGTPGARAVRAASCAEVVDGLALVTAIALRDAETAARDEALSKPPEPAPSQQVASPEPAPSKAVDTPPPKAHEPEAPLRLRGTNFGAARSERVPAGTLRFESVRTATLLAGAVVGWVPGVVLPRYELSLKATNFVISPSGITHLVGQTIAVRWTLLGYGTHRSADDYETRMNGLLAGVSSCSALTYDSEGWQAFLCGDFAMGVMHLDVRDPAGEHRTREVGVGKAGLSADFSYAFNRFLFASAHLGGEMALEFRAERPDGSTLFESNLFHGYAAGGLGVRF